MKGRDIITFAVGASVTGARNNSESVAKRRYGEIVADDELSNPW